MTATRATRIRVTDNDLKDIKPDSALYKRAVEELAEFEAGVPYREYASDHIDKDGDLEIDEDAVVSIGADDGAYIMCWKWIDHDAMREHGYLEDEDDDET